MFPGITCLFIAAKVEEVYPPKIGEFAYVTDGACTTDEILLEELLILKILSWSITPITINSWLNVYMQLASEGRSAKRRLLGESDVGANALRGYTFVFPQYSSLEFVICGQLIDLAVLHVDVNQFPYSAVAAAAMAHAFSKELAIRVSGEYNIIITLVIKNIHIIISKTTKIMLHKYQYFWVKSVGRV